MARALATERSSRSSAGFVIKGVVTIPVAAVSPGGTGAVNARDGASALAAPAPPCDESGMEPLGPQRAADGPADRALLDVREDDVFARGHLAGSGHLPRRELLERRAELPPRGTGILVVAGSAAGGGGGRRGARGDGLRRGRLPRRPARRGAGRPRRLRPAARLWRPARFLEEALPRVLAALPPGRGPTALDVACGAGRDAVFLAGHGFAVEARDHAPEALERARALAGREGVELRTVVCDLERAGLPPPERPFDLVVCFRFLHRPLFPWIEAAVAPGGWLVYETYRAGQERFGRPRRAHFLLAPRRAGRGLPGARDGPLRGARPAGRPRDGPPAGPQANRLTPGQAIRRAVPLAERISAMEPNPLLSSMQTRWTQDVLSRNVSGAWPIRPWRVRPLGVLPGCWRDD